MTDRKMSEVLREAHDVLLVRGWCQHAFENAEGSVCARGAISVSLYGDPNKGWWDSGCATFVGQIAHPFEPESLAWWQDRPGRTFDEVVDVFQKAIKAAEAEEALA